MINSEIFGALPSATVDGWAFALALLSALGGFFLLFAAPAYFYGRARKQAHSLLKWTDAAYDALGAQPETAPVAELQADARWQSKLKAALQIAQGTAPPIADARSMAKWWLKRKKAARAIANTTTPAVFLRYLAATLAVAIVWSVPVLGFVKAGQLTASAVSADAANLAAWHSGVAEWALTKYGVTAGMGNVVEADECQAVGTGRCYTTAVFVGSGTERRIASVELDFIYGVPILLATDTHNELERVQP